jgi:hypothetical protein
MQVRPIYNKANNGGFCSRFDSGVSPQGAERNLCQRLAQIRHRWGCDLCHVRGIRDMAPGTDDPAQFRFAGIPGPRSQPIQSHQRRDIVSTASATRPASVFWKVVNTFHVYT